MDHYWGGGGTHTHTHPVIVERVCLLRWAFHLSQISSIDIRYSAAAFLLQLPTSSSSPCRAAALNQQQRWATTSGSGDDSSSETSNANNMLPLTRRQRRSMSRETTNDEALASRNEALRRVGLVGLGAMMLGARPVEALQGGSGGKF